MGDPFFDWVTFEKLQAVKKTSFVYHWLTTLKKSLPQTSKADLKNNQKKIVEDIIKHLCQSLPGPAVRQQLASTLATIYSKGSTLTLFDTITRLNDIVKSKDDSSSYHNTRIGAIECLGYLFESVGRMAGSSFLETCQTLVKVCKMVESEGKVEVLLALQRLMSSLGPSVSSVHKDIYKLTRNLLVDKSLAVRSAAAKCCLQLSHDAVFVYTSDLDTITGSCLKSLDGSNYDVRCSVALLLGNLLAKSQRPEKAIQSKGKIKWPSIDEVLALLSNGFIKGSGELLRTSVSQEVRVGITQAYSVFLSEAGGKWVEKNLAVLLRHLQALLAHPKATSTHIDAVYSRKCVAFLLHWTSTRLLREGAQLQMAQELCSQIVQVMKQAGIKTGQEESGVAAVPPGGALFSNQEESQQMQHVLSSVFLQIGSLSHQLGTASLSLNTEGSQWKEAISLGLLHSSHAARLAASWCLRCLALACPSQLTPLIDMCMSKLVAMQSNSEALSGYCHALAGLLGCVKKSTLGIPFSKGKEVFQLAEEFLWTASQNSRLAQCKTSAGWTLIAAVMTLGSSVVKNHLPRMLLLWRNAFPRSQKELENEKAKGDAFTWQLTMEGRAGALMALRSFLTSCSDIVTDDLIRRLLTPIEGAFILLPSIPGLVKSFGAQLRASGAMVKLRLYQALCLLPPKSFEANFGYLLRDLVAEFTLSETSGTTTSLLRSMCHNDDSILFGSWLEETDHKLIEDQLQPNSASGSGALEHDPSCIYLHSEGSDVLGPLPLGVTLIDSSVILFGRVFPHTAAKHRHQLLTHFGECIKQAKSSKQQAVQINIFTAFISALKGLAASKSTLGSEDIVRTGNNLISGALASGDAILRCAAGEALGRLAQVVGDTKFVASTVQASFDKLKTSRDVISRTGYSLVLGCLHRYVGGLSSGHHLTTSVSILHALAQDFSSPSVQIWALHALALITDSGGPMFRSYMEPTLNLILQLLSSVPMSQVEVYQCLGNCLAALITSLGPELQSNSPSIANMRHQCLIGCDILESHSDPLVRSSAIACLQQLQLFAPQYCDLACQVPALRESLSSRHLLLRRASIGFLRQMVHRQAEEVLEYANSKAQTEGGAPLLEEALFSLLDTETDPKLISDVKDALFSVIGSLAGSQVRHWLGLCHQILEGKQAAKGGRDMAMADEDGAGGGGGGDVARFTAPVEETVGGTDVRSRWMTKVCAVNCIRKILSVCKGERSHVDLAFARQSKGDFLVLHLTELVRSSFIAATGNVNELRMCGLETLEEIIKVFASAPDPDYEGHSIFEQYQAQVGAALRPAFAGDTSPNITARACQVCSTWMSSGVCRNLSDLRRIQQLLVTSLSKLNQKDTPSKKAVYNESTITMQGLAVLKAWAEIYIEAKEDEENRGNGGKDSEGDHLIDIVRPELAHLSQHWFNALKDHAYLSLPAEFKPQLPPNGGFFYSNETIDAAKTYYLTCWPVLVQAAALWLYEEGFEGSSSEEDGGQCSNWFYLLLGLCVEALGTPTADDPVDPVSACLDALVHLFKCSWPCQAIGKESSMCIEVLGVMHRILLAYPQPERQQSALQIVKSVVSASVGASHRVASGQLEVGKSVVFGALQIAMCLLFQRFPSLKCVNDRTGKHQQQKQRGPSAAGNAISDELAAQVISLIPSVLELCEPEASVEVLPTVLLLVVNIWEEVVEMNSRVLLSSCLQALTVVFECSLLQDDQCSRKWIDLLQSAYFTMLNAAEKKTASPNSQQTCINVLVSLGTIQLAATETVTATEELIQRCTAIFESAINSTDAQVQLRAIQTIVPVFLCSNKTIALYFICSLGPLVMKLLESVSPVSDVQVSLIKECALALESLLGVCEESNRTQLLSGILPLLVDLISSSSMPVSSFCLEKLKAIGPRYPQPFKQVVNSNPELKQRLEAALRSSQATGKSAVQQGQMRQLTAPAAGQQPSIKLKMNFTGFS
eukprot:m.21368 g.21368  ORF g.21368 m.21368 type:complete len:1962 (+) comp28164_c0_seq1:139-6024(+)